MRPILRRACSVNDWFRAGGSQVRRGRDGIGGRVDGRCARAGRSRAGSGHGEVPRRFHGCDVAIPAFLPNYKHEDKRSRAARKQRRIRVPMTFSHGGAYQAGSRGDVTFRIPITARPEEGYNWRTIGPALPTCRKIAPSDVPGYSANPEYTRGKQIDFAFLTPTCPGTHRFQILFFYGNNDQFRVVAESTIYVRR